MIRSDEGELLASFGDWVVPVLAAMADRRGDEPDMRGLRVALLLTLLQRRRNEVEAATGRAEIESVDYAIDRVDLDELIRAFRALTSAERAELSWTIDRWDLRTRWGLYAATPSSSDFGYRLEVAESAGETERAVWCEVVAPLFRARLIADEETSVVWYTPQRGSFAGALINADCEPDLDPTRLADSLPEGAWGRADWRMEAGTIRRHTEDDAEKRDRYMSSLARALPCGTLPDVLYAALRNDHDALLLLERGLLGDRELNRSASCADQWCRPGWDDINPETHAECLALIGAREPADAAEESLTSEPCRTRPVRRAECLAYVEELMDWWGGDNYHRVGPDELGDPPVDHVDCQPEIGRVQIFSVLIA